MRVPRRRGVIDRLEALGRPRVPIPATPLSGGPEGPEGPEGPQGKEGKEGPQGKEGPAGKDGGGTLVGEVKEWPCLSLPTVEGQEFKWCDGTAISRTTYKTLFERLCLSTTATRTSGSKKLTAIPSTAVMKAGMPVSGTGIKAATTIAAVLSGTEIELSQTAESSGSGGALVVAPHGVGNGSTTFNLPDARGRTLVAPDDMGGTDAGRISTEPQRLGGSGGEERHTLSGAESGMPEHGHGMTGGATEFAANAPSGGSNWPTASGASYGFRGAQVASAAAKAASQSHNNMQPFLNVNTIIRVS